jgi:hypothetical protein
MATNHEVGSSNLSERATFLNSEVNQDAVFSPKQGHELEGAFLRNLIQNEPQKPRFRTKVGHYISVAVAAKRLGGSAKTVTRWCEPGTLTAIEKPFGNKTTYEIHPESVDMLLVQ